MELNLNFTQRMQLGILIDKWSWTDKDELRGMGEFAEEIAPAEEEKLAARVRSVGNGGVQWDELSAETTPFSISASQAKSLQEMLDHAPLRRVDLEWFEPIMEQLT